MMECPRIALVVVIQITQTQQTTHHLLVVSGSGFCAVQTTRTTRTLRFVVAVNGARTVPEDLCRSAMLRVLSCEAVRASVWCLKAYIHCLESVWH